MRNYIYEEGEVTNALNYKFINSRNNQLPQLRNNSFRDIKPLLNTSTYFKYNNFKLMSTPEPAIYLNR